MNFWVWAPTRAAWATLRDLQKRKNFSSLATEVWLFHFKAPTLADTTLRGCVHSCLQGLGCTASHSSTPHEQKPPRETSHEQAQTAQHSSAVRESSLPVIPFSHLLLLTASHVYHHQLCSTFLSSHSLQTSNSLFPLHRRERRWEQQQP